MKLGIYKHYKGHKYEVIAIGKEEESLEEYVVYKALYKAPDAPYGQIWIRKKEIFEEEVIVNNKKVKRFELILE